MGKLQYVCTHNNTSYGGGGGGEHTAHAYGSRPVSVRPIYLYITTHSLIVEQETVPIPLQVSATTASASTSHR